MNHTLGTSAAWLLGIAIHCGTLGNCYGQINQEGTCFGKTSLFYTREVFAKGDHAFRW